METSPSIRKLPGERVAEDGAQIEQWSRDIDWAMDVTQCEGGHLEARLAGSACGSIKMAVQTSNRRLLMRGCSPDDMVPLGLPMGGGEMGVFEGQVMGENDSVIGTPGREGVFVPRPGMLWMSLSMERDRLEQVLWNHERVELGGLGPKRVIAGGDGGCMLRLRNEVTRAFYCGIGGMEIGVPEAELEERVFQAVAAVVAGCDVRGKVPLRLRNREVYVRRAVERIEGNLGGVVRMSSLAGELGISGRTLELAFREVLGVRPVEYLQVRRLKRARDLLKGGKDVGLVRDVAKLCGLRHLGYFSRDYHALFGEKPGETWRMARKSRVVSG